MSNSPETTNWKIVAGVIMLFVGIIVAGYIIPRSDFYATIGWIGLAFGGYFLLLTMREKFRIRNLFILAILVRLSLLFAAPQLSDDINRFVWDGRILSNGGNPYLHLPQNLSESEMDAFGLDQELFQQLNSPKYYTVYPPLSQFLFGTASFIGNGNFTVEVMVLRLFMILAEVVVLLMMLKILRYFGRSERSIAIYAFNPLVIIELCGNLHFEGIEIMFLLLSLWLCLKNRIWLAGILFGFAVSVKLLPLMFLPFLFLPLGWKKTLRFSGISIAVFAILFLPFFSSELVSNFWSSLDLYFQRFEFNASFYFLIREIGEWTHGYNIIQTAGPVTAILVGLTILLFAFQKRWLERLLFDRLLFALLLYFLFATIVHPWYVVLLVAFSVFTPWRFPIWWSASVFLSYAFYHNNQFEISPVWLWIEYSVLFIALLWEGIAQQKFNRFVKKP